MGPQLDSCGRCSHMGGRRGRPASLQWGRNLTVAEGVGRRKEEEDEEASFNGAAT